MWRWVLAVGAAAVWLYFLVPGIHAHDLTYLGIGIGSTVCVAYAARRRRTVQRRGWYLVAAANACFILGDAIGDFYDLVLQAGLPFPSWADAFYLAGYPLLFTGVFRISRPRGAAGSREARLDAAMVSVGALALSWQLLMGSYAHDATLSTAGKLVTMAYPVMDLGVLFVVVNSMMAGTGRRAAERLLSVALLVLFIGDFVYDLQVLHGSYAAGGPVDAAFLLNYVFIAAAAAHPSAAEPHPKVADRQERRSWLPLIAAAGFLSPAILLISSLGGTPVDVPVLAGTCMVVIGLAVVRTDWLFGRLGHQTSELTRRSESLQAALITQQALEGDLRHRAFHDSLTGLPNRALLHNRVQHALESSPRLSGTVALFFCDLDGFKAVNDSRGHQFGDDLLNAVGKRLTTIVRPGDTVARLGGDEFAILLEDIDDIDGAISLADRIVTVLRQPAIVGDQQIQLSASVGLAFADSGTTTESLLSEADAAMYDAKAHGKDRYVVFETFMRARAVERMALMNAFQGSLQRNEFFLEYQPEHALAAGTLEGFEALVRWQHPTLGRIEPARFIPLAEETGFIVPLGRWILDQACLEAANWAPVQGQPLTVSVNVSGRQLQDPQLFHDVQNALAFSGLSPRQLILEITETVLILNLDDIATVLRQFKTMGIRIAIDDFGSGYSSLAYLRQFPVDILKIDKSFVDPLQSAAGEGAAFVQTILALARELRLAVTAEGVEQEIQRDALTRMHCHSAQGYLLSRPLGATATRNYIASACPLDRQPGHAPV